MQYSRVEANLVQNFEWSTDSCRLNLCPDSIFPFSYSLKLLKAFRDVGRRAFATKDGRPGAAEQAGELPGVPPNGQRRTPETPKNSLERERLLRSYDSAFTEMLERQGTRARSEALERIRPILYELSPEIKAWTGEARIRVFMLMKELAKSLDDPTSSKASLDLLFLLLSKGR